MGQPEDHAKNTIGADAESTIRFSTSAIVTREPAAVSDATSPNGRQAACTKRVRRTGSGLSSLRTPFSPSMAVSGRTSSSPNAFAAAAIAARASALVIVRAPASENPTPSASTASKFGTGSPIATPRGAAAAAGASPARAAAPDTDPSSANAVRSARRSMGGAPGRAGAADPSRSTSAAGARRDRARRYPVARPRAPP